MPSTTNTVWDAAAARTRGLKYKEAALSIIFDKSSETNKRENAYSLGKLTLGATNKAATNNIEAAALTSAALQDGSYGVISQGVISQDELTENCAAASLVCSSTEIAASNISCPRNKCIVGRVSYNSDLGLWRYQSENLFKAADPLVAAANPNGLPLSYFTEKTLRNTPSRFTDGLIIDKAASKSYDILPPLELPHRKQLRVDVAMRAFAKVCRYREACIETNLLQPAADLIRFAILSHSHSLGTEWNEYINNNIISYFYNEVIADNLLGSYLDTIDSIRGHILLKEKPRRRPSMLLDHEAVATATKYARPIYSRLPESYKAFTENTAIVQNINNRTMLPQQLESGTIATDPQYKRAYQYLPRAITDPNERLALGSDPLAEEALYTPADSKSWRKLSEAPQPPLELWATGGADKLLSDNKLALDQFFHRHLDPRTCDNSALDWTRQFFGFTDGLWDETWTTEQKRAILLNAFGWYDPGLTDPENGYKTLKGEVCSLYPFNDGRWVDSDDQANFNSIVWQGPNLTELVETEGLLEYVHSTGLKINKEKWQGLHQSKGTLLNMLWWISLFQIAGGSSHFELEKYSPIYHYESRALSFSATRPAPLPLGSTELLTNTLVIQEYFDSARSKALSIPLLITPGHTSSYDTATHGASPIIAGVSLLQTENIVVLPISFRYSRDSDVWNKLDYIVNNWAPAFTKVKAQYLYPAADFVAVGDVFISPEPMIGPIYRYPESLCVLDPLIFSTPESCVSGTYIYYDPLIQYPFPLEQTFLYDDYIPIGGGGIIYSDEIDPDIVLVPEPSEA